MEVDGRKHVDKEKSPPTLYQQTCSCVANLSSVCDYHVPNWLKAHEDTASQWTEDARCRFSPTKNTPVELSVRRAKAAVLITNI